MAPILRFALTVIAAIVIVGSIVAGPALLRSPEVEPPQVTPKPGITVSAKEMRTVPNVSSERRRLVTKEIGRSLRIFYTRGFIQPAATPLPNESPRPRPSRRVTRFLTKQARTALARQPGPFDDAEDLAVYTGTVAFGGLLTFDGRDPVEAFLDVDFGGHATPVGRSSPQVKVRQVGTIVLKHADDMWLVDGFDLKLVVRPVPTPTPGAS